MAFGMEIDLTDKTQPEALRDARWYMVNKDGMATLCTDRADAEKEAEDAQSVWPHMGPHRAVQLVEVASIAASAGSEPVAPSGWREAIGEIRAGLEDSEPSGYDNSGYRAFAGTVLDAVEEALTELITHPSPPEGMVAEQALRKVLSVVQRYLPPDGPTAYDAMAEITGIVDPWPLGPMEKP